MKTCLVYITLPHYMCVCIYVCGCGDAYIYVKYIEPYAKGICRSRGCTGINRKNIIHSIHILNGMGSFYASLQYTYGCIQYYNIHIYLFIYMILRTVFSTRGPTAVYAFKFYTQHPNILCNS